MMTSASYELAKAKQQEDLERAAKQRLANSARHQRRGGRRPSPWGWFDRLIHHRRPDRPASATTPRPSTKPERRSLHVQPFVIHTLDEIHASDTRVDIPDPETVEERDPVSGRG